ncbi:MAG: hypothetical protein ACLTM8_00245 [Veillonella parvula]
MRVQVRRKRKMLSNSVFKEIKRLKTRKNRGQAYRSNKGTNNKQLYIINSESTASRLSGNGGGMILSGKV